MPRPGPSVTSGADLQPGSDSLFPSGFTGGGARPSAGSVGTSEIADGSVAAADLNLASVATALVGRSEFNGTYARTLVFTDPIIGGKGDGATDNTAAFNAAMTRLASTGGELFFPAGVYVFTGTTSAVPGGVWLRGTGYDYHTPSTGDRPSKGAVLRATAAMTRLVQLGSDANVSTSGATGASIVDLVLDGNGLAQSVVVMAARRNRLRECEVYGGTSYGVKITGQNAHVSHSVISGEGVGDCVLVQGFYDNKVWQNQLREPGTTGACVRVIDAANTDIQMNHMWAGANGVNAQAEGLIVIQTSGASGSPYSTLITDNTIESVQGPSIKFNVTGGSSATIRHASISGNRFYQQLPYTDVSTPVVQLTGNGNVSGVTITSNTIQGLDSTHRYKSILDVDSTLFSASRIVVAGNAGTFCADMVTGTAAGGGTSAGNVKTANSLQNGSGTVLSNNWGKATFSGDASTTAFNIAHGLSGTPASVRVTPGSAAAAAPFYVTAGSANITVTFTSAPASGASNVVLNWQADV